VIHLSPIAFVIVLARLGLIQAASGARDSVCLVAEALRINFGEVFHGRRTQQLRVNGSHSVRAVRADNREIGHPNLARTSLFHQTNALDAPFVSREADTDFVQETAVNLVDDFQLTRKKSLKPRRRPFSRASATACGCVG